MEQADDQAREIAELRDRLSRLSQASLRINESLDFETVLQGVLDSACSLTGARYGVITLLDDSGRIEDFVTSGLTPEERQRFVELPEGLKLFEHLSRITEPLRLRDFHSHTRALGLPEFRPPMAVSPRSDLPGRAHPPTWGRASGPSTWARRMWSSPSSRPSPPTEARGSASPSQATSCVSMAAPFESSRSPASTRRWLSSSP